MEELEKVGICEEELEAYNFPCEFTKTQYLFLLLNVAVLIKNLVPLYYVIGFVNSLKLDYLSPPKQSVKSGCLTTNCTSKLYQRRLTSFPMFTLCQSNYQWLYSSLTGIQPIGLSLHCMYNLFIFLINVFLFLDLYYCPLHLDIHLFSVIPEISIKQKCQTIRKSLARICLSMMNLHKDLHLPSGLRASQLTSLSSSKTRIRPSEAQIAITT